MMRGAVWGTQESRDVLRDAEGVLRIPRKVERMLGMCILTFLLPVFRNGHYRSIEKKQRSLGKTLNRYMPPNPE